MRKLAAYLQEACGENAELRARVEQLLAAFEAAGIFLRQPAAGLAGSANGVDQTTSLPSIQERLGTEIGPYKLMEQIGEGGFGLVFVAEQQRPVRRKVALKVIKPGMDTRDVAFPSRNTATSSSLAFASGSSCSPRSARQFSTPTKRGSSIAT